MLEPGELITAVTLPQPLGGAHFYARCATGPPTPSRWSRSPRSIQPDGTGRVAFGGVAPKPWRVEAAEAACRRAPARDGRAFAGATPTHDNAFKLPLVERTLAAVLPKRGPEP